MASSNGDVLGEVRSNLRKSVTASAAPYGYTLTVFASGSVGQHLLGSPDVIQVLLFMTGAVLGFVAVEVAATGGFAGEVEDGEVARISVWSNAHLPAAGLAIGASWAVLQAVDVGVGWLAIGFVSTVVYLVVNAAQTTVAARATRM